MRLKRPSNSELRLIDRYYTVVEFELQPRVARAVAKSLMPEVRRDSEGFVKTTVKAEGQRLILRLTADEVSHLRAAVNSHLNLVKAAYETLIYSEE